MIGLFIAVTWGIGMFPYSTALFQAWEISLGRLLLITASVLAFYGLLWVRQDPLLSSLSRLTVYGCIFVLTLIASGLALYTDRSAVFVPLTLMTMLISVGFTPVLAIESYFFMFFLVAVTWIPSGAPFQVLKHTSEIPVSSDVFFLLSFIALAPGSIVAGMMCESIRKRTRPLSAGLAAGVIHVAMMIGLGLLLYPDMQVFIEHEYRQIFYMTAGVSFLTSVASGILLLAILPVVEKLFGLPTDLGLLELTDMNQPALRKLAMEAPGTYHHSLRVGTLCEEAAEAIGANALLARVGSYYHDIGKTTKPQYFIENSQDGENPHDRLPSNMSKLILIGHVRDGLELADEYGLPDWVKDFIASHHGTSVTEYFFAKQVQSKIEQGEEPDVDTADFRYPGPLPQSRETGICMLADSVEATSRSLEDPSPANIESMVDRIVAKKVEDGQLNESGLTLGEIKTIRRTFVEVLSGMMHARIEYPDQEDQEGIEETEGSSEEQEPDPYEAETDSADNGDISDEAKGEPDEEPVKPDVRRPGNSNGSAPDRQVFVLDQQDDLSLLEEDVRELAHFVLDAEQCDSGVSIVLLKKSEIQELHRQYLQEDRPTDVLAFPLEETEQPDELDNTIGEVMVCPAVARSRATDLGHSALHETYLYIIHGLLHLLGYDDKDKEEEEKMKTRQEELLESFTASKEGE
jgi:rRNA maturation RNase YbeY